MIGPDGRGYSNANRLRDRLRKLVKQATALFYSRSYRNYCMYLVLRILGKESERYGDDTVIADSDELISPRDGWSWARLDGAEAGRFVLSLGEDVNIKECPPGFRMFDGSLTWAQARADSEQHLADEAKQEELEAKAELLDYRFQILDGALSHFETFGHVPLYSGTDKGYVGVSAEMASEVTVASEERRAAQYWAFITAALDVIRGGRASESWSAVCKQVDTDLNRDHTTEWREGRARRYARELGAVERPSKGAGKAEREDTVEAYKRFKAKVLELYEAGVAEGRPPVRLSRREDSI